MMLLVAVLVLTSTVSADGSISGVYSASLNLAARSANAESGSSIQEITKGIKELVGRQPEPSAQPTPEQKPSNEPKAQPKQGGATNKNKQENQ
jgi:hypothetical protein